MLAAMATAAVALRPAVAADRPRVQVLVPGTVIQAVEGIDFGPDGTLYGTSIHGQAVYRIDVRTGAVGIEVPSPEGESDDIAVGPVGTAVAGVLAWTAQTTGEIRMRRPGGKVEVILPNAPRVNPIAFRRDGRLFTAQVGAGDNALWELDATGARPPRLVTKGQGRLNGFGFGPDGRLYAPLFGTSKLVAVDPDSGAYTVISENVGTPAAAKADARGDVISVDYMTGDVWKTTLADGHSRVIATLREPLDNLAIAADGTVYLSNVADSAIHALDPETGTSRTIVPGWFTVPLGMTMARLEGREMALVADPFGYRYVDPKTGEVYRPHWAGNRGASSSVAADARFIAFAYANSGRMRRIDRATDQLAGETADVKTPRGLALAGNGDVVVADAATGRLVRWSGDRVVTLAEGLAEPVALVLENETVALVTEFARGAVARVDLARGARTEVASGFDRPTGLARMADGRIAVVEPERGTVTALAANGESRAVLADGLPLSIAKLHLPANTPAGIAVDRAGAVIVACGGDNSIRKLVTA